MSGLISCGKCARYIQASASACPFCRARQGSALAPRLGLAFAFAVASATTIACDSKNDGGTAGDDDTGDAGDAGDPDDPDRPTASQGSVGNETIADETDTWAEGSTYAGPDEFDTTGQYDSGTSTGSSTGSSSDGLTTDQSDWGEGSTYAGPDEFGSTGGSGSSGTGG